MNPIFITFGVAFTLVTLLFVYIDIQLNNEITRIDKENQKLLIQIVELKTMIYEKEEKRKLKLKKK